jgi:hypothetical protein
MSGPNVQPSQNIATQQTQLGQQYASLAQQSLSQMNTLEQPAISYYSNLVNSANSGNYSALVQSAGPTLGTIAQQQNAAQENIYANVPAGAGRDYALAMLPQNTAGQVASTLNQQYTGGLQNLAALGSGYGSVGLQEAGAGLSGLSGASQTQNSVMNAQAQSKASTLGFLGSLTGAAASVATGGLSGAFGSLGGSQGGGSPQN